MQPSSSLSRNAGEGWGEGSQQTKPLPKRYTFQSCLRYILLGYSLK